MLLGLEPGLRAQVEKALAMAADATDRDYTFVSVQEALSARGVVTPRPGTLSRHQHGKCDNCPVRDG